MVPPRSRSNAWSFASMGRLKYGAAGRGSRRRQSSSESASGSSFAISIRDFACNDRRKPKGNTLSPLGCRSL